MTDMLDAPATMTPPERRREIATILAQGVLRSAGCPEVRALERLLERAVSEYLGAMSVLWLDIGDGPGPSSDRAYIERNLIGVLSPDEGPSDPPSASWLGLHSPLSRIRRSGLWNLDHLKYPYSSDCLDALDEYVRITAGMLPRPAGSIAPGGWYADGSGSCTVFASAPLRG